MVISNGRALDCRSQFIDGSRAKSLSFIATGDESFFLSTGWVEPDLNVLLPVFPQMDVRDHVVMFDHSQKSDYLLNIN